MSQQDQINKYIASLSEQKQKELAQLHQHILQLLPSCKIWFLDGKNENGQMVTNPNIGYGSYTINYANGKTKDFYQIGISANTTGISVYIMGLSDKKYLQENYSAQIGKAKITGYCIKFKSLEDIDMTILKKAILDGYNQTTFSK